MTFSNLAFTGHRPKDLPAGFGYAEVATALDALFLRQSFVPAHFITGGALGIDTWAAQYALSHDVDLTLILPFPVDVMAQRWHPADRATLADHAAATPDVRIISAEFNLPAYQQRNEAMVDASDAVLAFWTGKRFGGTWNCLEYARSVNRPRFNLLNP